METTILNYGGVRGTHKTSDALIVGVIDKIMISKYLLYIVKRLQVIGFLHRFTPSLPSSILIYLTPAFLINPCEFLDY
jgi:hypothetical protein